MFTQWFWILFSIVVSTLWAEEMPKNWAVLVAGSNGWYNYRHQADVCHAYQLLKANGIPEENIITMMYDDIAYNAHNQFFGKIFNDYQHNDVYQGVQIDYRGKDVTPAMFLDVLLGSEALKEKGFKVLDSGPEDNLFIFFSDHGAPNLVAFPNDILYAEQFVNTLKMLRNLNRIKNIVVYVEACFSGSMFEGLLAEVEQVYATTAADSYESSWATFCGDKDLDVCLADHYSYAWINDSAAFDLQQRTVREQFEAIQLEVRESHVSQYGDDFVSRMTLYDFQAHGLNMSRNNGANLQFIPSVDMQPSYQAHLVAMMNAMKRANDEHSRKAVQKKLNRAIQLSRLVVETFDDIVKTVAEQLKPINAEQPILNQMRCYQNITDAYLTKCFTIQQVPEVARELIKFQKLCQSGYDARQIVDVILNVCG